MTGLAWTLKRNIKNGYVRLSELRPHSRMIAERMLANGELFVDGKGYLRLNSID
jgi:hypothetical protein